MKQRSRNASCCFAGVEDEKEDGGIGNDEERGVATNAEPQDSHGDPGDSSAMPLSPSSTGEEGFGRSTGLNGFPQSDRQADRYADNGGDYEADDHAFEAAAERRGKGSRPRSVLMAVMAVTISPLGNGTRSLRMRRAHRNFPCDEEGTVETAASGSPMRSVRGSSLAPPLAGDPRRSNHDCGAIGSLRRAIIADDADHDDRRHDAFHREELLKILENAIAEPCIGADQFRRRPSRPSRR